MTSVSIYYDIIGDGGNISRDWDDRDARWRKREGEKDREVGGGKGKKLNETVIKGMTLKIEVGREQKGWDKERKGLIKIDRRREQEKSNFKRTKRHVLKPQRKGTGMAPTGETDYRLCKWALSGNERAAAGEGWVSSLEVIQRGNRPRLFVPRARHNPPMKKSSCTPAPVLFPQPRCKMRFSEYPQVRGLALNYSGVQMSEKPHWKSGTQYYSLNLDINSFRIWNK